MVCPKCKKSKTKTVDVRYIYGYPYRLRECYECGYTFYTVEKPVEMDERFKSYWKIAERRNLARNRKKYKNYYPYLGDTIINIK